jgi:RND family efflux transporter MFP subunit
MGALTAKRRRRRVVTWLIVLAAMAAGAAWALVNRPWEPKPTIVAVETVTAGAASRVLAINGRVTPAEQVEISSTVNGRVASVEVEEGDVVAQGAALLLIDDTQQRAAVAQAQSQVDAAATRLAQAQMDYERARALGDSIAQKSLDDARFAVEAAQNDSARAIASFEQAQSLLTEYTVRAPFAGTVLSRGADAGQVVNSSTSLFLFAELSTLHAEASVDELYASEIQRGLAVKARPAGHSATIDGEVLYVSPRVDASTGGRLVRMSLPGAGELGLPVGLTVMLNIVIEERDGAITVPRTALIAGDEPAVYVVEGGTAVRRPIQYVDWPSERLIVLSGLSGGEALVVESISVDADGALVAPKG